MSWFHSALVFAQTDATEVPDHGWITGPTIFFTLMGACLVMIVVGAVVDRLPEEDEEEEDTDADEEADAAVSQTDKRKAKLDAKAAKKLAKAEKKKAKAGKRKGKKGKGKKAVVAVAEPAEPGDVADLFADRADESVASFAEDGETTAGESIEFEDETSLDDLDQLGGDFGTDDDFQFDVEPEK